jgi:hypothetical protein
MVGILEERAPLLLPDYFLNSLPEMNNSEKNLLRKGVRLSRGAAVLIIAVMLYPRLNEVGRRRFLLF